jgi:hypothetical protein
MLELQMKETMQLLGVNQTNEAMSSFSMSTISSSKVATMTNLNFEKLCLNRSNGSSIGSGSAAVDGDVIHNKNYSNQQNKHKLSTNVNLNHSDSESNIKMLRPSLMSNPVDDLLVSFSNNFSTLSKPTNSIGQDTNQNQIVPNKNESKNLRLELSKFDNHKEEISRPSLSVLEENSKLELALQPTIKDAFILNQIDIINKYYQIDDRMLAEATFGINTNKLSPDASFALPKNTANAANLNSANQHENVCSLDINFKSDQSATHDNSTNKEISESSNNTTNIISKSLEEMQTKSISSIMGTIQSKEKKIDQIFFIEHDKKIEKKVVNEKSNEEENSSRLDLNISKDSHSSRLDDSKTTNPSRAFELRHFIEMLLTRSPSGEIDTKQQTKSGEILGLKHITAPESAKSKITKKHSNISSGHHSTDSNTSHDNLSICSNFEIYDEHSNSECSSKKNSLLHSSSCKQDLSDIELGYTKRQSSEYYDDVKKTLKFDDDDDEEEVVKREEENKEKKLKNNKRNRKTIINAYETTNDLMESNKEISPIKIDLEELKMKNLINNNFKSNEKNPKLKANINNNNNIAKQISSSKQHSHSTSSLMSILDKTQMSKSVDQKKEVHLKTKIWK